MFGGPVIQNYDNLLKIDEDEAKRLTMRFGKNAADC